MRENTFKRRLDRGEPALCGWLAIPSGYSAEIIAKQGFDAVTVDLQHGMLGFDTAVGMLQAIASTPATPIARVADNDAASIMKLLDAGAYGIICPMISSVRDARRFTAACRYPPAGSRSFGPARGLLYGGSDYFPAANREILTIGMIETREGLAEVDAIAAVDDLDALFVGPNDLSISLGAPPSPAPQEPSVLEAIDRIRNAATRAGKPCGIFCTSGRLAAARLAEGFGFVVPGSDAGLLLEAARQAAAAARPPD